MLKHKVIGAFVAVWLALCVSYGGIRAALATILSDADAPTGETATASTSIGEQTTPVLVEEQPAPGQTETSQYPEPQAHTNDEPSSEIVSVSTSGNMASESSPATTDNHASSEEPAAATDSNTSSNEATMMSDDASSNVSAPTDSSSSSSATSEPTFSDQVGPTAYGEEEQVTEAADVPTLEEYLSQFTCGSCRRNCSLANPRCHNGSRLADAKAQEYYEMF